MAVEDFPAPQTRKSRIVCISDTHNSSPKDGGWKLPKGDILIHAGDLTNQGTFSELQKTIKWIEEADFEVKVVIAGNHDITLDQRFYAQNWQNFHNQNAQDAVACQALLAESPSITYLNHSSAQLCLTSPSGPQTRFSIFGSPYVPSRGLWAFGYDNNADAAKLWDQIPQGMDIVVTHTPPKGLCDSSPKWGNEAGCSELRKAVERVRPHLAVCGHVHEGRGALRLKWPGIDGDTAQQEVITLDDAARSKKPCVVNLTRKTAVKLDSAGRYNKTYAQSFATPDASAKATSIARVQECASGSYGVSSSISFQGDADLTFARHSVPNSPDLTGLEYSADRDEVCVVNAAILATSYRVKPKRFNKPIVVDMDLPVCDDLNY